MLDRDLTPVLQQVLDGDPDRGIVVLGPDRRAVYANDAARLHLQDGTPRAVETLLPESLQPWLDAYCARVPVTRGSTFAERSYPSDDDRRLRITLETLRRAGGPFYVLRTAMAVPWSEPTIRRMQLRFHLTLREAQVVHWVARGLSNEEAANKLGIVAKTVKNVLMSVYGKMRVRNRVELALRAHDAPLRPVDARTP